MQGIGVARRGPARCAYVESTLAVLQRGGCTQSGYGDGNADIVTANSNDSSQPIFAEKTAAGDPDDLPDLDEKEDE